MKHQKKSVRPPKSISWAEREQMIKEYLAGNCSKVEIFRKYTGADEEHGYLLKWMRKLGYLPNDNKKSPHGQFSSNYNQMPKDQPNEQKKDTAALERRIKELEERLKLSEIKVEGLELTIEIAEKELKIPIRKKSGTK